jgi:hypothetical protein
VNVVRYGQVLNDNIYSVSYMYICFCPIVFFEAEDYDHGKNSSIKCSSNYKLSY